MPELSEDIDAAARELRAAAGITSTASQRPRQPRQHAPRRSLADRVRPPAADPQTPGQRIVVSFAARDGAVLDDETLDAVIAAFATEKASAVGHLGVQLVEADPAGRGAEVTFVSSATPGGALVGAPSAGGAGTLVVADAELDHPVVVTWAIPYSGAILAAGSAEERFAVTVSVADGDALDNATLNGAIEHAMAEMSGPAMFGTLARVADSPLGEHAHRVDMVVVEAGAYSPTALLAAGGTGGDRLVINGRSVNYLLTT